MIFPPTAFWTVLGVLDIGKNSSGVQANRRILLLPKASRNENPRGGATGWGSTT